MPWLRIVAALLLVNDAWAVNPHDGKWRSVEAKSYWSDGALPKGFSLTIDIRFEGVSLAYHSVNDTDPSHPVELRWTAPVNDTVVALVGNPRFNQVRVRQLGPGEFQVLEQKDGDVIVGQFWTFSNDGKTLIRRGVGKSSEGRSKAFEEVFARQ